MNDYNTPIQIEINKEFNEIEKKKVQRRGAKRPPSKYTMAFLNNEKFGKKISKNIRYIGKPFNKYYGVKKRKPTLLAWFLCKCGKEFSSRPFEVYRGYKTACSASCKYYEKEEE